MKTKSKVDFFENPEGSEGPSGSGTRSFFSSFIKANIVEQADTVNGFEKNRIFSKDFEGNAGTFVDF